jgi:serine/threonine protein kinase
MSGACKDETWTLVGTPTYMSPEQCDGESLDRRSDIYSLGVIFYEMVFGYPPFRGETAAAIIKSHLMATLKIPQNDGIYIPPRIISIMRKMLAKSPDHRYTDMKSVAEELTRWKKELSSRNTVTSGILKRVDGGPLVVCFLPQASLLDAVASGIRNIKHQMIVVSSADELLSTLSKHDTHAVLLSQNGGGNDVFGLAQRIRASEKNKKVKLILMSDGISRHEVETAFLSGIDDIIAEPFNPSVRTLKLESMLIGEQQSVESRRSFRKNMSEKVAIEVDCKILDISDGGMRIETNMALKIGETIKFDLPLFHYLGLGGRAGKVVWISKSDSSAARDFQAGIDFIDFSRSQRKRLRDWIAGSEHRRQGQAASTDRLSSWGAPWKNRFG